MRLKATIIVVVAVSMTCMAFATATNRPIEQRVAERTATTRANGTLGNLSATISQTGALQAQVDVSATTAGGSAFAPSSAVLLYGQVYDYPWVGGTPANTFVSGSTAIIPSATAGGQFNASFSFTVPTPNTFQAFALAFAGYTSTTGAYSFYYSQRTSVYPGPTTYIDNQVPPTATPDPNAGGQPIPTINGMGIAAMMLLLAGVAVLLITRRS